MKNQEQPKNQIDRICKVDLEHKLKRFDSMDFHTLLLINHENLMNLSWNIIYFGVKYLYLDQKNVFEFAEYNVENNIESEKNLYILINSSSSIESILQYVKDNFIINLNEKDTCLRKLRYLYFIQIFDELKQKNITKTECSKLITNFYDEHGYPEDMNNMIEYMPIKDGEKGGYDYIIKNFEAFLKKEKEWIMTS